MKFIKITNLLIFPLLMIASLTSCSNGGNNEYVHYAKHGEFVKCDKGLDYLYEVTYQDYSYNDVTNWMNSNDNVNLNGAAFGCSSIHKGNYYGRSFDFCFTDMCEFLVRTNRENGHYASIGISIADAHTNEEKILNNTLDDKLLPFCMVDGINENGVVCNTNVVPAKDLIPHPGEEVYFTHGTNIGKPDLFYQFMPRFVLDNATSAKHAVDLLKQVNITAINKKGEKCDYLGISKMGYELHLMVADKDDTYIIELVDDNLVVLHSGANIMTNYY